MGKGPGQLGSTRVPGKKRPGIGINPPKPKEEKPGRSDGIGSPLDPFNPKPPRRIGIPEKPFKPGPRYPDKPVYSTPVKGKPGKKKPGYGINPPKKMRG